MTLHLHENLVQGTPDWHRARCGIVTASEVGTIITPGTVKPANNMHSRAYAAQIAAERITGRPDETYTSADMERGWQDEPDAINAYSRYRDTAVTLAGFMTRDDWGWTIGYSPDGLVGDGGLLEIKSRRPKKHLQTIVAREVPPENVAQCQAALLVSGRDWLDYVSYCAGMRLYTVRVTPDPFWQKALVDAVEAFEEAVEAHRLAYYNTTDPQAETEWVDHNRVELRLA